MASGRIQVTFSMNVETGDDTPMEAVIEEIASELDPLMEQLTIVPITVGGKVDINIPAILSDVRLEEIEDTE